MMYKVLKIKNAQATSFLDLLNLETGTIDHVFDDSDLRCDESFEFMEEGKVYNCKMRLFGDFTPVKDEYTMEVAIWDTDVMIGDTKHIKVAIGADIYYVLQSDAQGIILEKTMLYSFSRKDLIQVDAVVHADLL